MQILAVDDDELALMVIERDLVRAGYQVVTAHDGREALNILRRGEIRMVISDWNMPGLSGISLCQAIRAEDANRYVYCILLTSNDSAEHAVIGLSAGADDFMCKPFNPAELIFRVRAGERVLSLQTHNAALLEITKLAESRDPDSGAHVERVQNFSRVLAKRLSGRPKYQEQIDADFIRLIYAASALHDIGNITVPDAILLKPGKLDEREYEIVKTHTEIGARTLEAALGQFPDVKFLRMARDIAASHHERWDGRGYPTGLAGDKIPLSARIVAVADAYDVMTTKRVYKPAYDHEVAKAQLLAESGRQFDPDVVDAFMQSEDEFLVVHQWSNVLQLV
jgi:putative two-component system response regulator